MKPNGLVILAAAVVMATIGGAYILIGSGADHITAYVTATIGPAVAALIGTYIASINGNKADQAKQTAEEVAQKTEAVAQKADAIHGLVNGGLETRVRAALGQVLTDMVGQDGRIILPPPPSMPPNEKA